MPWPPPNTDWTWTDEQKQEFQDNQAGKWMWVDASDSRVTAYIIHQHRLHGWRPKEMPRGDIAAFVHPNRFISNIDLTATKLPQQKGGPIPDGAELEPEVARDIDRQLKLHLDNHGVEYDRQPNW